MVLKGHAARIKSQQRSNRVTLILRQLHISTLVAVKIILLLQETHRQEEPLRSAGFEEFLPLGCVVTGEADGVNCVVELGANRTGPRLQLQHIRMHWFSGG